MRGFDLIKRYCFSNTPKAVLIRIFCKFTNNGTALAPFGAELNMRSIQVRASSNQSPVSRNPTQNSALKNGRKKNKNSNSSG